MQRTLLGVAITAMAALALTPDLKGG